MKPTKAIIQFTLTNKNTVNINYNRRMYAIIRKYTPDVLEGEKNECLADITGLRTFFKMSYVEIAQKIQKDLKSEIGFNFFVKVISSKRYDSALLTSKKQRNIATYKEINSIFAGNSYSRNIQSIPTKIIRKKRLTIPFIGKVS